MHSVGTARPERDGQAEHGSGGPVKTRSTAVAAFLLIAVSALAGIPPATAAAPASVYLIQGVEGTSWSMTIDGDEVAKAAPEKEIVGPLRLMPGSHTIAAVGEGGVEVTADLAVKAGGSVDVVLHRPVDPTAAPLFTSFANDLSPVGAASGRLTVAHTAVAPPADIRVNGEVLLADVASAEQITTTVPAGIYPVEIVPAATDGPAVLGPVDLSVKGGRLTRVFAIGVASERNMDAVVQVLPLPVRDATPPKDVPAGLGGAAQGEGYAAFSVPVGLLLLAGGSVLAVVALRGRREPR